MTPAERQATDIDVRGADLPAKYLALCADKRAWWQRVEVDSPDMARAARRRAAEWGDRVPYDDPQVTIHASDLEALCHLAAGTVPDGQLNLFAGANRG